MWLIAGLGNPGRKYSRTRHNIGFMVIEEVAGRHNIELKTKSEYNIGRGSIEGQQVVLLEPLLYMNRSGTVIWKFYKRLIIPEDKLIVVHDDIDMEKGKIRIRERGSSGGHKGIESIIQDIGTREFIRVKIGIGRQEEMPAEEYVLRKFSRQELNIIKDTIQNAADAVQSILLEGVGKAMNKFN
jgi:PTH1 family peptidyl-tRNA hydrolase